MSYTRFQSLQYFFLLALLIILLNLTACVDLSGSSFKEKINDEFKFEPAKHARYQGEVYTMRGGLGIFSIGMNMLRDSVREQFQVPASSFMWYRSGPVSRAIAEQYWKEKTHKPIILIGHSLGANEQIMVARYLGKMGVPVDLLVTVEAVSVTKVSANVKEALNIYKPGFVPMFSGLRLWAVNPNTTHIENVNVNHLAGVHVNHFTIDKNEIVQNMILNSVEKVLTNANQQEA